VPFVLWCVRNLASAWLLALGVLFAGAVLQSEWVLTVATGLLLLVTAEGLRRWWHRSPVLAGLIGVGAPAAIFVLPLTNGAPLAWELGTLWLPALIAAVIEVTARRNGWAVPAASNDLARRPLSLAGCLVTVVVLGVLGMGGCLMGMRVPVLRAEAFKNRVRPGMTAGEVAAASLHTGNHLVFVSATATADPLWLDDDGARYQGQRVTGADAVKALVNGHATGIKLERLSFLYLSWIPVRSSIVVTFGPDARVTRVEGPFNHPPFLPCQLR
jgi:hypothetical protein